MSNVIRLDLEAPARTADVFRVLGGLPDDVVRKFKGELHPDRISEAIYSWLRYVATYPDNYYPLGEHGCLYLCPQVNIVGASKYADFEHAQPFLAKGVDAPYIIMIRRRDEEFVALTQSGWQMLYDWHEELPRFVSDWVTGKGRDYVPDDHCGITYGWYQGYDKCGYQITKVHSRAYGCW